MNPPAAGFAAASVSTGFAGAAVVAPPKLNPPAAGFAAAANGEALVAAAPPPKPNPAAAAAGFVSAAGSSGFFSCSGDAAAFAFPLLGGVPNPNPLPGFTGTGVAVAPVNVSAAPVCAAGDAPKGDAGAATEVVPNAEAENGDVVAVDVAAEPLSPPKPKLNVGALPGAGAAGNAGAAGFALASSSSSSAFCALAYPALAFARNAAPNPLAGGGGVDPAGTAEDGASSAFSGLAKSLVFAALPGGEGAGDPASAGDAGISARGGRTRAASNRTPASSSRFPSRMHVSRASAVATSTSGPCGSFGRDLSAGCVMRPPQPVVSSASPTTKFESSSSPARGMEGTQRSSSTSSTHGGAIEPSGDKTGGRTAHSWLSQAFLCDASATFHSRTRRACAYGPTRPAVSSSSMANAPLNSNAAALSPPFSSTESASARCDSGSSRSVHNAKSVARRLVFSSPTRNAKPFTTTSTAPSSHGPTGWCVISALYPASVSRATTAPPPNGAHAASAPRVAVAEASAASKSSSSSGPRATANARTPSAMATGAVWSRVMADPTTSFAFSPSSSVSFATSAR